MNKNIYEYLVEIRGVCEFYNGDIKVPLNAKIFSAQKIGDDFYIYAIVDPTETEMVRKQVLILETGHALNGDYLEKLEKDCVFLGTYQSVESDDTYSIVRTYHVWCEK